jgi:hypothetical protein
MFFKSQDERERLDDIRLADKRRLEREARLALAAQEKARLEEEARMCVFFLCLCARVCM